MAPPRFKDLPKAVKSLLTDGWKIKRSAKVEAAGPDGQVYSAEWEKRDGKDDLGTLGVQVAGSLPAGLTGSAVVRASLNTEGKFTDEVTVKGLATGLEVTADYTRREKLAIGARYSADVVTAEASVDVLPVAGSTHDLDVAVTAGASGVVVGGHAVVPLQSVKADASASGSQPAKKLLKDFELAASYTAGPTVVSLEAQKRLSLFTAGFAHALNSAVTVGASLGVTRAAAAPADSGADSAAAASYTLTVGASHRGADGAVSRLRLDTKGELLASYSARLSSSAALTLVGRVNTRKADSAPEVGLQLAIK